MSLTSRLRKLFPAPAVGLALRIALACCLLAVETLAVVHRVDLAAHTAGGDHCYICIGVASFGNAAPSEPLVFVFDATAPVPLPAVSYAVVALAPVPQVARGPPHVS